MSFIGAFVNVAPLREGVGKTLFDTARVARFTEDHGEVIAEWLRAVALLLAYVLQFIALVSLLKRSGGPIDSPFAQMALAIAIFTPFIMNKYWSMVLVLGTTMVYYAWLVTQYGFADRHDPRPSKGSYRREPPHRVARLHHDAAVPEPARDGEVAQRPRSAGAGVGARASRSCPHAGSGGSGSSPSSTHSPATAPMCAP
jgi:hypothetical protein